AAPTANHDPREDLDAFLIAFDHLCVDSHAVADSKVGLILPKLFRLNFIKYCLIHKLCSMEASPACAGPFLTSIVLRAIALFRRGFQTEALRGLSCPETLPAAYTADIPTNRG